MEFKLKDALRIYIGDTRKRDENGCLIEEKCFDKVYTVWYDTNTGKTYYSSMMLPTGSIWTDITSDGTVMTYARSKGYNNIYDVTYAEFQELLGVYNGD